MNSIAHPRKLLTLLCFLISIPVFAQPQLQPDDLEDLSFSEAQVDHAAKTFVFDQKQILLDVLELSKQLEEKKEQMLPVLGKERIKEIQSGRRPNEYPDLNLDDEANVLEVGNRVYAEYSMRGGDLALALGVVQPGVGKAKPTNIDKVIFPRVVHEKSGIVFLLIPKIIDLESPHLKQYSARLATKSNLGKGRPYVYLHVDHSDIEIDAQTQKLRYQYFDQPKTYKEKAKYWWNANYVAPTKGAAVLTFISVAFQAGTSAGISYLNYHLGNTAAWDLSGTYMSIAFGSVFGMYSSFYNNVTSADNPIDPVSRRSAMLKRMLITSATFAYSIQILSHGIDSISLSTSGGWLTNIGLWTNTLMSNTISDHTTKILSDMREEMGLSRGEVKVLNASIRKTQFENQMFSLVPRVFRMFGLLGTQVMIAGSALPVGNAIFFGYYVGGQYLVMRYAEHVGYKYRDELRNRWESFWGPYFRGLGQIAQDGLTYGVPADPFITFGAIALKAGFHTSAAFGSLFNKDLFINGYKSLKEITSVVGRGCNQLLAGATKSSKAEENKSPAPFTPSPSGEWMEVTF